MEMKNSWLAGLFVLGAGLLTGCDAFNPYMAGGEAGLKVYWGYVTGIYVKEIKTGDTSTTAKDTVVDSTWGPFNYMAIDKVQQKLYYTTGSFITSCKIGQIPSEHDGVGNHSEGDVLGLAVDGKNARLYFSGPSGTGTYNILVYDLTKTFDTTTRLLAASIPNKISELQLDIQVQKLYWIEGSKYVKCGELNGTGLVNIRTVLDCSSNLGYFLDATIRHIAISPEEQKIYLYIEDTPLTNAYIFEGDMNAGAAVPEYRGFLFYQGDASSPVIKDIDIDPHERLLDYSFSDTTGASIRVCDLKLDSKQLFTRASSLVVEAGPDSPFLGLGMVLDRWPGVAP